MKLNIVVVHGIMKQIFDRKRESCYVPHFTKMYDQQSRIEIYQNIFVSALAPREQELMVEKTEQLLLLREKLK